MLLKKINDFLANNRTHGPQFSNIKLVNPLLEFSD